MILYIGNNIKSKLITVTTISTLSKLLVSEGYEVKITSSIKNQFFRMLSMLWTIIKYKRTVDYVLIDTYSTKNFYFAFASSQLCRILGLKYMPILHGGNLPNRLGKSPKTSSLIFNNAYKNIAPSEYLQSEFNNRDYQTIFIPNVLEIGNYNYLEREITNPKLLYVRAFDAIYNPEMAIQTLNVLKQYYPDAALCMIGPEKDNSLESCKALAKSFGIEGSVEFTGVLSKPEWHKKAEDFNIFINTTNIDNTPVSVMEAMALGLPIVSTNVGGIPYLITDRVNGLLVEKNNVKGMVNAIIEICSNEKFAKSLTHKARIKAEQFDWQKVRLLWQEVLQ